MGLEYNHNKKQTKRLSDTKKNIHPRSLHRGRYEFDKLIVSHDQLSKYTHKNKYGDVSIDFFKPEAVKALNISLLKHFYGVKHYDIPIDYLCPPIPGRADYIHHIADHLANHNNGIIPKGKNIKCLDIGVGANCIYPILGHQIYGWTFVGTDIDPKSIDAAQGILSSNPILEKNISLRVQSNKDHYLKGILRQGELFDIMICNPPFHSSKEDAIRGTTRKLKNLKGNKHAKKTLNFSGQSNELWTEGGEKRFIRNLIRESRHYTKNCKWFSCLVSKESNLKMIAKTLEKYKASDTYIIQMEQGNKKSRIVVWRFKLTSNHNHTSISM